MAFYVSCSFFVCFVFNKLSFRIFLLFKNIFTWPSSLKQLAIKWWGCHVEPFIAWIFFFFGRVDNSFSSYWLMIVWNYFIDCVQLPAWRLARLICAAFHWLNSIHSSDSCSEGISQVNWETCLCGRVFAGCDNQ